MAVTKTWEARTQASIRLAEAFKPRERRRETWWLAGASLVVACGLGLVLIAKTQDFPDLESRLDHGELLDLNQVTRPEQLLPVLQVIADSN